MRDRMASWSKSTRDPAGLVRMKGSRRISDFLLVQSLSIQAQKRLP
jgi:undecaprenyl pyrophosphate synthase